jgi:glycosyltransferase involved in cell wall biosynthesis
MFNKRNHNTSEFYPKVSIIIPVFNGSNYLKEAIDSALAQTYKNLEIIVVNDGSADNTEEIALSFGNKIRYFNKKNGGTATALNLGIRNMKGSYFSWLSHDDMYYPNKIARQIEELGKLENKNTIMMSDLDGIDENYKKIYQTNYIEHLKQYPSRLKSKIHPVIYNQTHGCTLLIPKTCFDEVGLFDEKELVAHDFEYFYRIFLKYPHKLIPEVLVTARDSSNRQGRRSKGRGNVEYSRLFIKIIENLTDEEIKLLAPDKLSFYTNMRDFFWGAGYSIALEYMEKKIVKNLQISSHDLIGNKFNGYDLHLDLREKAIDSKCLVFYKHSKDENTFAFNFYAKDATKELIKLKLFYDTDIVHMHLVHNILDLNYLPIISRLKPTILSLHDPFFLAGHCVHHFDCMKWQKHCQDCPYVHEPIALDSDYSALNFELKKQAIQNSQVVGIVASKWLEKKVRLSPIWQNKKIYFLPFGINQDIFKPEDALVIKRRLNIAEKNLVLMFRSDAGPYKGLKIIKQALEKLVDTQNITLITVGEKHHLKEFKDKYQIIEYDWINDDDLLASLYTACDLFLMPSKQEAFGMMAIEAMSCGKMVLALEGGGTALPEVINSPECSLAVSEEAFSKELQRLIANPKEVKERGEKSLAYAKGHYSKDRYIKGMLEIYKEVIANHQLDEDSKLILEQLKKYMVNENSLLMGGGEEPKKSFLRRIYGKLPIEVRKLNKRILFKTTPLIGKFLPTKIKNKIKSRVNIKP